jgi:hypothetical protein
MIDKKAVQASFQVKQVYDATSRWIETHLCHFGLTRRKWSRMKGRGWLLWCRPEVLEKEKV